MSRPTKLTDEAQDRIVAALRVGNTIEAAAAAAGIDARTFRRWMARGASSRAADAEYRAFREAVERARAQVELVLVSRIAGAAAKGSWRAAAWLLEHRF